MSVTTERALGVILTLYVAASAAVTVVLPWMNELLHPKTESDGIAALGVGVGIITVLLVAIQIFIALQQVALQKTELRIIERQANGRIDSNGTLLRIQCSAIVCGRIDQLSRPRAR